MKRLVSFTFTLLLLLSAALSGCGDSGSGVVPVPGNPFAAAKVGTDSTLEIVTWNLENFAKNNGTTVDYVVDAILGLDVDIVALQEIESATYFEAVVERLNGWSGYRATSAYGDLNLAFIYRDTEVLEIVRPVYPILQGLKADDPFPRDPLVLEFNFLGTPLVLINNHLKCCGNGIIDLNDPDDEETRRLNASLLLQQYIEANFSDRGVIVVGDFNDELDDGPGGNVFANFLDDPENYRFVDLDIALDRDALWSYPTWPSHLDHILITQPLIAASEEAAALVQVVPLDIYLAKGFPEYEDNVSDHLPVLLRLQP